MFLGKEDFLQNQLKPSKGNENIDFVINFDLVLLLINLIFFSLYKNALTEEEKLNLIVEESPELLSLLKDYKVIFGQ